MKNIYLIGFMGTGKSSVGKQLAEELQVSFVDLDQFIVEKYRMEIKDIFRQYGEQVFREYEKLCLREVKDYQIIATGGGVVEQEENINEMKSGSIIHLDTSFEAIEKRLKNDDNRPLWNQDRDRQAALYNRRKDIYKNCSDLTIDTTNYSIIDVVKMIISFMNKSKLKR